LLSGASRLDGGVQGGAVRLGRDAVDDADDVDDLARGRGDVVHRRDDLDDDTSASE